MHYNPQIHQRRSIRLWGYDYSQEGLYFITICCQHRAHLFGQVQNAEMIPNAAGEMVANEWLSLKQRFPNIELHDFVVMPNHFHGIVEIAGQAQEPPLCVRKTIGDIMKAFKSISTNEYIRHVKNADWLPFDGRLWQRNYYEHIIRDARAYDFISAYILQNPAKWQKDTFYTQP